MATTNTFREDAIAKATKQPQMVDELTEESPILARMPVQDATAELHNVYEQTEVITAAQIVDGDEALPIIDAKTSLKQVDLSIIGGVMEVGEDKANLFGGAAAYFAGKRPMILRQTGNDLEQSIIYNNLRAYAQTNGKLQDAGGTTANTQNSIIAVTWKPGEIIGLTSPNGFGNGAMMDELAINGGNAYFLNSASGVLGYGIRMKSYLGIQLANTRYVSGIANIEIDDEDPDDWNIPTEEDIEVMLEDCRAQPGTTLIYCAPKVRRLVLGKYKAAKLRMDPEDKDFDRMVDRWDGVEILTSRNFLTDGEAVVS
jgi:hypothetical protein